MSLPRLKPEDTQLLIVDVQERLCAAMPEEPLAEVLARTQALLEGAHVLALPTLLTEQYPKGLGPTVPMLMAAMPAVKPVEKLAFSACVPELVSQLGTRKQVLLAGMEAHICVFQTVRDLVERGFTPFVCADAVLSRAELDYRVGISLCERAGAVITTVECALFELLGRAGSPAFKAISQAVK